MWLSVHLGSPGWPPGECCHAVSMPWVHLCAVQTSSGRLQAPPSSQWKRQAGLSSWAVCGQAVPLPRYGQVGNAEPIFAKWETHNEHILLPLLAIIGLETYLIYIGNLLQYDSIFRWIRRPYRIIKWHFKPLKGGTARSWAGAMRLIQSAGRSETSWGLQSTAAAWVRSH